MLVRLGFSVAVDVRPDLLVVDEVLSVGDEAFKRKSQTRIDEMIAAGTAVLLLLVVAVVVRSSVLSS